MTQSRFDYLASTFSPKQLDAADVSADTTTLSEAVKTTFMLAMNGDIPLARRAVLNSLGKELRDQLRDLLGRIFAAGTPELVTANKAIKDVNADLQKAKQHLDKVADTIEGIGKLIASLDKLLQIATKIV